MNKRKTEVLVGFFVLLSGAALIFLALKIADVGATSSTAGSYVLNAKFDNIGGLKVRSPVKVGGVLIGRVANIYLDEEDWLPVVEMKLSKKYDSFPETSSASILTSGLLGEQYVGIVPGFMDDDIEILGDQDFVYDTKSALVLEDLVGQFLYRTGDSEN